MEVNKLIHVRYRRGFRREACTARFDLRFWYMLEPELTRNRTAFAKLFGNLEQPLKYVVQFPIKPRRIHSTVQPNFRTHVADDPEPDWTGQPTSDWTGFRT